jgi:hypothetical protein
MFQQQLIHPEDARSYQWHGSLVGRDVGMAHEQWYKQGQPTNQDRVNAAYQQRMAAQEQARQQALYEKQMREQWEEQKKNNEVSRQAQVHKSKALRSMALGFGGGFSMGGGSTQAPSVDLYSSSGQRIGGSFGPIGKSLLG